MSWDCPHQVWKLNGEADCARVKTPCIPLMKGCVLNGRYRSVNDHTDKAECHVNVEKSDGEPMANVPRSVKEEGHRVMHVAKDGDSFRLYIEKA